MIKVSASKLNSSNLRYGDVVEGNDGTQYFISDFSPFKRATTLEEIEKEGYVKPEFLDGKVDL